MGHSAEEKIKILYEDSLQDIRELTAKMEAIAMAISAATTELKSGKSVIRAETERLLIDAVKEIKGAVQQIVDVQGDLNSTAANSAQSLLAEPLKKLDYLVRKQVEALGWMNRAANFYERTFVLWPMVISAILGSMIGGAIVRYL
jgi:hypothetical protein